MTQLIFSEEDMINGNIFKFEQRLQTHMTRFIDDGAILTTYFAQEDNSITVDRGTRDIEELFGDKSPLRHVQINNLPLYTSADHQTNPENNDKYNIEDINIETEYIVRPGTIVPKVLDFFIINHLKMTALFEVKNVIYDSMKSDGFYKIQCRLHSTSKELIEQLKRHVVDIYHTDLNAIGTNTNPIIKEDDYVLKQQIEKMVNQMIKSYRALYYNSRHNCFLFHDPNTGEDYFDVCGNEFIAKYSIMNPRNSTNVIILHDKLQDSQMLFYYNNSVYNWIEVGAPQRLLQKFYFILDDSNNYPYSSFYNWSERVNIIKPITTNQAKINFQKQSYFDEDQFSSFMSNIEPATSEYDKLIWKYIHKGSSISIHDISLYTADALLSSIRHRDIYLYTPIIIYIMRQVLRMN